MLNRSRYGVRSMSLLIFGVCLFLGSLITIQNVNAEAGRKHGSTMAWQWGDGKWHYSVEFDYAHGDEQNYGGYDSMHVWGWLTGHGPRKVRNFDWTTSSGGETNDTLLLDYTWSFGSWCRTSSDNPILCINRHRAYNYTGDFFGVRSNEKNSDGVLESIHRSSTAEYVLDTMIANNSNEIVGSYSVVESSLVNHFTVNDENETVIINDNQLIMTHYQHYKFTDSTDPYLAWSQIREAVNQLDVVSIQNYDDSTFIYTFVYEHDSSEVDVENAPIADTYYVRYSDNDLYIGGVMGYTESIVLNEIKGVLSTNPYTIVENDTIPTSVQLSPLQTSTQASSVLTVVLVVSLILFISCLAVIQKRRTA